MKLLSIILALSILSVPTHAENQLEGAFVFAGPVESNGDLSKGNSHIHFEITGNSAMAMYKSFEGEPYEDTCTGLKFKGKANVGCYEISANKTYICGFAINLNKGRTEASQVGTC